MRLGRLKVINKGFGKYKSYTNSNCYSFGLISYFSNVSGNYKLKKNNVARLLS